MTRKPSVATVASISVLALFTVTAVQSLDPLEIGEDGDQPASAVSVGQRWPLGSSARFAVEASPRHLFLVVHEGDLYDCAIPTYPLRHLLHGSSGPGFTLLVVGGTEAQGHSFLVRERLHDVEGTGVVELPAVKYREMGLESGLFLVEDGAVVGTWKARREPDGELSMLDEYRS